MTLGVSAIAPDPAASESFNGGIGFVAGVGAAGAAAWISFTGTGPGAAGA